MHGGSAIIICMDDRWNCVQMEGAVGKGGSVHSNASPYPPPMALVDLLHEHEMGQNLMDLSNKGHFQGPK